MFVVLGPEVCAVGDMRACVSCGVPEERRTDTFGRVTTNLSPLSDECVKCIVARYRAKPKPMAEAPFDAKIAQSGEGR